MVVSGDNGVKTVLPQSPGLPGLKDLPECGSPE